MPSLRRLPGAPDALLCSYFLMQKAKDADVVGIVAGTLGVANYRDVVQRLKQVVKQAGKKSYTFLMGKLNVAKLANFMEVDVFVLVACPENTLVCRCQPMACLVFVLALSRCVLAQIDSSEFYRPVVTPFEMEIACLHGKDWTGDYVTDFRQLLPELAKACAEGQEPVTDADEEPSFSLISGTYKLSLAQKNQTGAAFCFGRTTARLTR